MSYKQKIKEFAAGMVLAADIYGSMLDDAYQDKKPPEEREPHTIGNIVTEGMEMELGVGISSGTPAAIGTYFTTLGMIASWVYLFSQPGLEKVGLAAMALPQFITGVIDIGYNIKKWHTQHKEGKNSIENLVRGE